LKEQPEKFSLEPRDSRYNTERSRNTRSLALATFHRT